VDERLRQAPPLHRDAPLAYAGWCDDNGEKPITKTGFRLRLTERGFTQAKAVKGVRVWNGLRLLAPDETPNAPPVDDAVVCAEYGTNGVDLPGLACDECMGVTR
jgi:hypothetical protein